jgi:hypothetical protein
MDTNDLTLMAHEMLDLADSIDRTVLLEIASICHNFDEEDKYLHEAVKCLEDIIDDPDDFLDFWNLEDEFHPSVLKARVRDVVIYAKKVLVTPKAKRGITYEQHEFEMPKPVYMTDLSHFLDENGKIIKSMPKEAREMAGFFFLIKDAVISSEAYEIKTEIRCFKPGCDGKIFIRLSEEENIEWHCLMCGVSGIIHNWHIYKCDNSS